MTDPRMADLEKLYPRLVGWQRRGNSLQLPQAGSELEQDDRVFPTFPISQLAKISLDSAGEHLRLSRDALQVGQVYATAHFTALRGALVGASQAVWLLSPDDAATRRERGLIALQELHGELRKYYNQHDGTALNSVQKVELTHQKAWSDERIAQLEALRTTNQKFSQTHVIEKAVDFTFADREDRDEGRLLWRAMSADAHVLGWSMIQRHKSKRDDRASGLSEFTVAGDVSHVAGPFAYAFEILNRGWSMFDRRCEAP